MAKVCILGGGSWGIGLSVVLHKNGHEVTVWSAVPAEIQMLQENHEHKMLPGVKLPEDMIFTTDDKQAIEGKDLLVMAVASSYTRSTAHRISPLVAQGQKIVSVSKGIEEHTLMTQAQIIEDEIPQAQVAVLSGPTHAEEVSRGQFVFQPSWATRSTKILRRQSGSWHRPCRRSVRSGFRWN